MSTRRLWQALACVAISLFASSNGAHSQDRGESCTKEPPVTMLSNRATLDAETRLYKVESTNVSTLSILAYELDPATGRPTRTQWRTPIPSQPAPGELLSRSNSRAAFDVLLVGSPRAHRGREANDDRHKRFLEAASRRNPTLYVTTRDARLFSLNATTGQRAQVPASPTDAESRDQVGATLATGDVRFEEEWRTMLVVLTGGNPATLQGIDVTDPDAPEMLWTQPIEMKSENVPKPAVVQSKRGGSVIFTVGGTLHIRDAITGTAIREIAIDGTTHTLSDPAAADLDRDGIPERIYAGDDDGNLWAFDLSSPDTKQWRIAFEGRPLTTVPGTDGSRAQIGPRPEIALAPDARTPIVFFTARSPAGIALYAVPDRINGSKERGTALVAWRRELGKAKDLLEVSRPRVHDAQVHLVLKRRVPDTCDVSTSIIAVSIGDGKEQLNLSVPTAIADQSDHSGADAMQAPSQSVANRLVILDHATPSGECVRHFYLGTSANGLHHAQAACRKDTFGRQSWRQLR